MRVLVTGARGKVGRATVPALQAAGHDVTATDRHAADFDRPPPGTAPYVRADLSAYGAAKAAMHHATKILAVELGPLGIRCNAVAPGFTRSEMTGPIFGAPATMKWFLEHTALGRAGEPEDVARVVAFLASDDAGWVTGQTITASGGLLL